MSSSHELSGPSRTWVAWERTSEHCSMEISALNENLDKRAFYAAFRNATNSVFVAAKRCAFSSK